MANKWEVLESKIRQAAKELTALKRDRSKMKSELDIFEQESQKVRELLRENIQLKEEKKRVLARMEKLHTKLTHFTS